MSQPNLQKICRVCGDVALSFNFNGMCCDPCKTFFRRNSQFYDKLKCYSNGKCSVTIETRRYCPRCRMTKCLEIGMDLTAVKPPTRKTSPKLASTFSPTTTDISERLLHLQTAYNHHCLQLLKQMCHLLVENPFDRWSHPPEVVGYTSDIHQAFNLQEHMITIMVNFTQTIPEFNQLTSRIRVRLFRDAFPQLMLLRGLFYFHAQQDGYVCRLDEAGHQAVYTTLDCLYMPGMKYLIEVHRGAAEKLVQVKEDTIVRDLLSVLILFKTTSKSNLLPCSEYLHLQYTRYLHLLQRYLAKMLPTEELFHRVHANLLEALADLDRLQANVNQYYEKLKLENNSCIVSSHALAEIYEIRN